MKLAKEFSSTPGSRYIVEGDNSGEEFRQKLLYPRVLEAIKQNTQLIVDLDGTAGYSCGFLEEAFGGLIRVNLLSLDEVNRVLKFQSDEEPELLDEIQEYLEAANESLRSPTDE
jgi:hypothetical protein